MSKFWFLLCYFLGIKQKLSTVFYLQTNGQSERQNSIIEAYLRAFGNWKQNNLAALLPMAELIYNNAKNACTSHTLFKLNYGYNPRFFFKDDVDSYSRSYFANKLAKKLKELIDICQKNLLHAQELQKRAYDKGVKI